MLKDLFTCRGRAPIASMDAMEELDGMDILTGSNPAIQPECHLLGKGVVPGLRYRHLGKSGLKVTFACLPFHPYICLFPQIF